MQAIPMTLRGAEKLREELDFLKSVRRPEIIAAIAERARTWRFKRKRGVSCCTRTAGFLRRAH